MGISSPAAGVFKETALNEFNLSIYITVFSPEESLSNIGSNIAPFITIFFKGKIWLQKQKSEDFD